MAKRSTRNGCLICNEKKITVIGNGALSLSIATQMGSRGGEIVYVDVRDGILPQTSPIVHVIGKQEYDIHFNEITNSYLSVSEADIVSRRSERNDIV